MRYNKVTKQIRNADSFEFGVEFQVPQMDSISDAVEFYGSEANLLDSVNKTIERNATTLAKFGLMKQHGTSLTEMHGEIEWAKRVCREYSPQIQQAKPKITNLISNMAKRFSKMSPDEILDMLVYPEFTEEDWKIVKRLNNNWWKQYRKSYK